MLMAATGHGPYRGETVMDVLAQLATAQPDLSGLPADLADVVTACLEPDPARRPTAASMLAQLTEGNQDDQSFDLGPALLSVRARALIADYRRALRPLARPDADADGDDTLGSLPALGLHWGKDPDSVPGSDSAPGSNSAPGGAPGGADNHSSSGEPRRRASRRQGRALAVLGASVTAIALLAAGTAFGGYLAGGRANAGGDTNPRAAGGTSVSPASGTTAGRSGGAGPGATGSPSPGPAGPPGLGPPPAPPPNVRALALATGMPAVALNQPFGDTHSTFVVMGAGFPAGARITIRLAGAGSSAGHTTADDSGAFNFAINQGHEFFRGWLPPGTYRVEVIAPGGFRQTASMIVTPATA
jgi:hypothetical protein